MLNEMLLAYDGSDDSDTTLSVSVNIADNCCSEINALNVLCECKEFAKPFSDLSRNMFNHWRDVSQKFNSNVYLLNIAQKWGAYV